MPLRAARHRGGSDLVEERLLAGDPGLDADGTPDDIQSWHYDAEGNLRREERDKDGDGTPEEISTYDANGNLTREEGDRNDDGTPESSWSYQYDANGNLTRIEYDPAQGGERPTQIINRHYDDNDNMTREEVDGGGDGTTEIVTTAQYEANGWGQIFGPAAREDPR